MTAVVKHISDYPAFVPVLNGAAKELVGHRELRGMYTGKKSRKQRKKKSEEYYAKRTEGYQTNRSIKTWSCFFLLKALTTSGKIQNWTHVNNKARLLTWLQMEENTFRSRIKEMTVLNLVSTSKDKNRTVDIILTSWEKAAAILGIQYTGTTQIKYNPDELQGKQIFQFVLRAEEFKQEQQKQLEALMYHLDKNPLLKNDYHLMLLKHGADDKQLRNPVYFQQRLLSLQMHLFKEGSDILDYIFSRRADINRSGNLIKEHHSYKSTQSVSYLKRRMHKLKVIIVQKIIVESACRSRLYIPDGEKRRDGYKWLQKKQHTAWFLTDQITFKYATEPPGKPAAKAAA